MAHLKFSEAPLCTQHDIECEIVDISAILQGVAESEKSDIINRAIGSANKLIENRLKGLLPEIYSNASDREYSFDEWMKIHNYSYAQLNPVLDMVSDISKLKDATVALTITCLIKRMIVQYKSSFVTTLGLLGDQRSFWQNEYETRMRYAEKELVIVLESTE